MIDLERPGSFGKVAVNVDIAKEKRRIGSAILVLGKQSVASRGIVESAADAAGALGLTVHAVTACAVILNSRHARVFTSRYSMHSVDSGRRYRPINSIAGARRSIRSIGSATSVDAGASAGAVARYAGGTIADHPVAATAASRIAVHCDAAANGRVARYAGRADGYYPVTGGTGTGVGVHPGTARTRGGSRDRSSAETACAVTLDDGIGRICAGRSRVPI